MVAFSLSPVVLRLFAIFLRERLKIANHIAACAAVHEVQAADPTAANDIEAAAKAEVRKVQFILDRNAWSHYRRHFVHDGCYRPLRGLYWFVSHSGQRV